MPSVIVTTNAHSADHARASRAAVCAVARGSTSASISCRRSRFAARGRRRRLPGDRAPHRDPVRGHEPAPDSWANVSSVWRWIVSLPVGVAALTFRLNVGRDQRELAVRVARGRRGGPAWPHADGPVDRSGRRLGQRGVGPGGPPCPSRRDRTRRVRVVDACRSASGARIASSTYACVAAITARRSPAVARWREPGVLHVDAAEHELRDCFLTALRGAGVGLRRRRAAGSVLVAESADAPGRGDDPTNTTEPATSRRRAELASNGGGGTARPLQLGIWRHVLFGSAKGFWPWH